MLRSFFLKYMRFAAKWFVILEYIDDKTGKIRKNKGAYHVKKRKISVRCRGVGA